MQSANPRKNWGFRHLGFLPLGLESLSRYAAFRSNDFAIPATYDLISI